MTAAARLNNAFRAGRRPFKVVILCRTDICDRLPGANINKIRQDHAVRLHWYDDPTHPQKTRLVHLINLRARRSLGRRVNVFSEFLPRKINGRNPYKEILNYTRHTPRDLIQLFVYLQQYAHEGDVLATHEVHAGLRAYSLDYFFPEIRNEMHGYLHTDEIQKVEGILREHGEQYFTLNDLEEAQGRLGDTDSLDIKTMTRVLFDCSAIGFIDKRGKKPLRTMKYRNPHARLPPGKTMWLHPAACRALNIPLDTPAENVSAKSVGPSRR